MLFMTYSRPDGGYRVSDLKGVLAGRPVFLVGGSPSFVEEGGPSLLSRRGIASFAINNAALSFRPTAMLATDDPRCIDSTLLRDPSLPKFMQMSFAESAVREGSSEALRDMPGVLLYESEAPDADSWFLSEGRKANWRRNTLFLSLAVLHHLGASRVYLAGSDFDVPPPSSESPEYAHSPSRTLTDDEREWNRKLYTAQAYDLLRLKPVLERGGLELVDCSPRSKVAGTLPEAYRRSALADAVEECLSEEAMPSSPDASHPHASALQSPSLMREVLDPFPDGATVGMADAMRSVGRVALPAVGGGARPISGPADPGPGPNTGATDALHQ